MQKRSHLAALSGAPKTLSWLQAFTHENPFQSLENQGPIDKCKDVDMRLEALLLLQGKRHRSGW